MTDRHERRKHERTELVLKVSYEDPRDLLSDYLTDLGDGGLFICTPHSFEIGEEIEFEVSFPGLLEPVPLRGIVRWCRRAQPGEDTVLPDGIGIEFAESDKAFNSDAARLIARIRGSNTAYERLGRPFRVLLVEDNSFAHRLFEHAVRKFHRELDRDGVLEIIGARDGEEALAKLDEGPIDLAIIDYYLPIMTGDGLIRQMREHPEFQATPVLVISVGGENVREQSLQAGANLYLDKPVLLRHLLTTLRTLLQEVELEPDGVVPKDQAP